MSIKWQDMLPDTEVLTRSVIPSIHTLLQKAQVRWAGHVTRMSDDRLPKQLLYGELFYGKRSVGGQNKRFKDTRKKILGSFNIDFANWEACAQDRPLWRSMVRTQWTDLSSTPTNNDQTLTIVDHFEYLCVVRPSFPMIIIIIIILGCETLLQLQNIDETLQKHPPIQQHSC